jgi:HK97 family phage major capsid protein
MSDKDQKHQDELKARLKEALKEEIDERMSAFEERQEKRAKELEKMASEDRARLEAIEAMPATKVKVPVPGKTKTVELHRGYDLNKQGLRLKIADNDRREEIAKWFINVITGKAALQEGTTTEGGYLVPDEYGDEIIAFARVGSIALQDCRIWPMGTDVLRVPAEDGGVTVGVTAEETDATESEPTFREVVLTAKRVDAFSVMSNELLNDSKYDVVSHLTELFGEATGKFLDTEVIAGTSLGTGIETASGVNEVQLAAAKTIADITATNLSEMIMKLEGYKLPGAKFYAPKAFAHYARLIKDGAGSYIWGAMNASDPGNVYGYPLTINDQFPASAVDTIMAIFGNLKYVALGRRDGDMSLDLDPYGLFKSYQTRTRIVTRWALSVAQAAGLVRLMSGNAVTTTTT